MPAGHEDGQRHPAHPDRGADAGGLDLPIVNDKKCGGEGGWSLLGSAVRVARLDNHLGEFEVSGAVYQFPAGDLTSWLRRPPARLFWLYRLKKFDRKSRVEVDSGNFGNPIGKCGQLG